MDAISATSAYWSKPADELMSVLASSPAGLDAAVAAQRLQTQASGRFRPGHRRMKVLLLFLQRFRSPLILILIFAAAVAVVLHDWLDALIVLGIILVSALLGFFQEYRAGRAVEKLRQRVQVQSSVRREGRTLSIPSEQVVPGDIVLLAAGSLVPGDGVLVEARDFFVSQALLTGETFPVEKQPGQAAENASLIERHNCVFMGTSVRSGTAIALMVHTGRDTGYGQIVDSLELRPPETEFERGLRQFGGLLVRIMVVMVIAVLVVNIALRHPTMETVLFAMALAVGLSPEMLPAILSVTLARGAQNMARHGVIVKRLNAIENLGSMDVLCTDKTGTLTKGVVQLDGALDVEGQPSEAVLQQAYLNAQLQTGLDNPLDQAVVTAAAGVDLSDCAKLDEIPYDFVRKRLSIVIRSAEGAPQMITKGALQNVLEVCDRVQLGGGLERLTEEHHQHIQQRFSAWSEQGYRVLGVAQKALPPAGRYARSDEQEMVFTGFLLFFDPPEEGVRKTLNGLRRLGVQLKIITGDNHLVARHVAEAVGIKVKRIITGAELVDMKDEALWHLAPQVTLFAEVDPNQKERIITALQKSGHVVGYLGDGINDAPALHAADVGVSVDQAVDVAKEAADFVLLEHDLEVLRAGIDEGRHAFANTLKYIFITTSANFGNMVSMALATLYLPFLPLLAKQILLNNLLSDIPAMGIAGDNVDRDWERTPHRWDIRLIRNFMISFGLLSTVFDLLAFGVLLYLAGGVAEVFRTGWFVESLVSELLILFVIRTYKPFYKSRPGRILIISTLGVAILALLLPYLPIGAVFDLVPLPPVVMLAMLVITAGYVLASELAKRAFYRRFG